MGFNKGVILVAFAVIVVLVAVFLIVPAKFSPTNGSGELSCGNLMYDPGEESCCGGVVWTQPGLSCCGESAFYDPEEKICCEGEEIAEDGGESSDSYGLGPIGYSCCGSEPYHPDKGSCCLFYDYEGNLESTKRLPVSGYTCCKQ
ncbi:MAG: hypothetical protein AABX11_05920 [Nanoarchaeota archaeon]